jgi:hypothetical protein
MMRESLSLLAAVALVLAPLQTSAFSLLGHQLMDRKSWVILQSTPQRRPTLEGMPSSPGWKKGQLNRLTDWAMSDEANRAVIDEYDPDGLWLWTKWHGTVLSLTFIPVLLSICLCATVDVVVHSFSTSPPWPLLSIPPANDPIIGQLQGINKMWEYQLTLATFILTFFTADAYKHWQSVYFTTRAIQGRINDICLLVTLGAERGNCTEWGCGVDGQIDTIADGLTTGYSEEAAELVRKCTRLIKLSHTFFWAATPTCSDGVGYGGGDGDNCDHLAIGPLLLSTDGLERLVAAGELTAQEKVALIGSGLPPSQYAYILLEWVGLYVMKGIKTGTLSGGYAFEENILRQITALRGEYFNIGDLSAGRMPLAYVQLVQVLVDSLLVIAPLAIYPDLGIISYPLTAIMTIFYKGLLELSKAFLDPFGNEGYLEQNIRVDVLVSELNFGAGSRWVKAGESLPASKMSQDEVFAMEEMTLEADFLP